jgi:hypothetical protein
VVGPACGGSPSPPARPRHRSRGSRQASESAPVFLVDALEHVHLGVFDVDFDEIDGVNRVSAHHGRQRRGLVQFRALSREPNANAEMKLNGARTIDVNLDRGFIGGSNAQ